MSADVILGPPFYYYFCAAACSFDLRKDVMIILYTLHAFGGHMTTTITGLALLYFPISVPMIILSFTFPNWWK
jgi:hypothetical protein